jgi:hypothetical protein
MSFASECPLRLNARPLVAPRKARMGSRPGETPVEPRHNSDDWFRGTAAVASQHSYSSFVPSRRDAKNV